MQAQREVRESLIQEPSVLSHSRVYNSVSLRRDTGKKTKHWHAVESLTCYFFFFKSETKVHIMYSGHFKDSCGDALTFITRLQIKRKRHADYEHAS